MPKDTTKSTGPAPAGAKARVAKRSIGRPAKTVEDKDLRIVEDMAGRGARLDAIATVIGVSPSTLDRWLTSAEVRAAYDRGRTLAIDNVAQSLYNQAMGGNVVAAIFWMKAQAGWTDKPQPEKAETAKVVVYIPDNERSNAA
ncbi:hypothetical protein [Leptothoe sp. PORK10 BA2]|uniref:hypothetical protein n=1 Tax=Leptothoe sp. PORK10 BA2 TaxID=3110254 RepID=UPI002B1FE51E|nr:hypothetical protein [Leptothoe sp. PORK10 BA2]MEA5465279.1 hypothetical protein [Leptothoe sp. PORK10 BA2]